MTTTRAAHRSLRIRNLLGKLSQILDCPIKVRMGADVKCIIDRVLA
jgi:hypothetical protein